MLRPIHFPMLRAVTAVAVAGLSASALAAQAPAAADPGGSAPAQVLQGPAAEFVAGSAADVREPAPGAVPLRLAAAADTQRIRVCKDLTLCEDTLTARIPKIVVTFPRLTFDWPHPPQLVSPERLDRAFPRAFPWWVIPVVGGGIAIGGHHGHEERSEAPPDVPPETPPEVVAEPGTLILAASGLAAVAAAAARRRRARS